MIARYVPFDAFGDYVTGGPIDQIIDAFDKAKVLYMHRQLPDAFLAVVFLGTPRAMKIVKRVQEQQEEVS